MKRNEPGMVIEEYNKLQILEEDIIGHIEKLTRTFGIPRLKGILAKQKVSDAVQIMAGTRNTSKIREFDPTSRENIVKLVDELGSGRSHVLFMRKEDGSGVVEMFTGKEYNFAI